MKTFLVVTTLDNKVDSAEAHRTFDEAVEAVVAQAADDGYTGGDGADEADLRADLAAYKMYEDCDYVTQIVEVDVPE